MFSGLRLSFSGLSILLLATGGSSYYCTGDTSAAVSGYFAIVVITETEVIFIGMDN
jgi:hypothetical protein